jgi:hypothetical protein
MNKYTTIQIKKETHELLQTYCKERGYTLSGLVESLIKQRITQPKPTNILAVKTSRD